jgi:Ala-tRNA(Pro) deacylase
MLSFNKLREFLDNSLVAYEVLTHPVTFTARQLAAVQHVKGKQLAKVVVARSGSEFIMIVLPAPYHIGLERARAATGRQELEIAHESEFASLFAGCEPGAMPPFGNLYNVRVWVDESLAEDEEIVFNACTHTQAIKMKYSDFARLARPTVAKFRMA